MIRNPFTVYPTLDQQLPISLINLNKNVLHNSTIIVINIIFIYGSKNEKCASQTRHSGWGGGGGRGGLVIITIVHVFDEELNSFLESKFELLIHTRI